jgi:hypothetical protein
MESCLSESLHPAAPHHLPSFITAPGDTDILMVVVGIVLIGAVLAVGNLYLHLHTLPERMAQCAPPFPALQGYRFFDRVRQQIRNKRLA